MGTKGDRQTAKGAQFAEDCVSRLAPLKQVSTKKMFGGFGIYQEGKMFALITSDAELFFKVDGSNREQFAQASAAQHGKMPYFRVPDSVLSDDTKLVDWAKSAVKVAHG